jgi:hypothetical protein
MRPVIFLTAAKAKIGGGQGSEMEKLVFGEGGEIQMLQSYVGWTKKATTGQRAHRVRPIEFGPFHCYEPIS